MEPQALMMFRAELQQRMAALERQTGDPLALLAALNQALSDLASEFRARNGGEWHHGQFNLLFEVIDGALARAEQQAIARAVDSGDAALRDQLRAYFLLEGIPRYNMGTVRFDRLAALGDAASVEMVFAAAAEALATEVDDDFNPTSLVGLVGLAQGGPYRERALAFFRGAFDQTIAHADEDDMANDTAFATLGRCVAQLGDPAFGPILYDAFAYAADPQRHYEMNLAASRLAICLSIMGYRGPLGALEDFVAYLEKTYPGEEFTLRACYALWMIRQDGQAATAYLADPAHMKSLGLAATACADLDHKPALPAIEETGGRRCAES